MELGKLPSEIESMACSDFDDIVTLMSIMTKERQEAQKKGASKASQKGRRRRG